jgi:hypothetical protein
MTRRKLNTATPRPAALPPRERFAELTEIEREFIRETMADYGQLGAYGYDEEGRLYASMVLAELLLAILRHVQEIDGAPARCRNRQCRGGRCHMFIDGDEAGVCHGGIRKASIDRAGVVLSGVMAVFKHFCPAWFDHAAEREAAREKAEEMEEGTGAA